jgi:hypothetical protein
VTEENDLEPTEVGFYKYSGGRQTMLFLRDYSGQWYVILDHGTMEQCTWGYIEQALGVWELEKIT